MKSTFFESGNKALSKVLISGGGRCNVTNYTLNPKELVTHYPRGAKELLGPFTTFGVSHTMEWFTNRGAPLKVEDDKRVFPQSNKSQTIANCLLERAREKGVHIHESEKKYMQ
jgi:predicted flavoprotein YhiN